MCLPDVAGKEEAKIQSPVNVRDANSAHFNDFTPQAAIEFYKKALTKSKGRAFADATTITYSQGWFHIREADGSRAKYRKRMLMYWARDLIDSNVDEPLNKRMKAGHLCGVASSSTEMQSASISNQETAPASNKKSMIKLNNDKGEDNSRTFATLLIIGCVESLIVAFYAAGNSAGPNGQAGRLSSDSGLFIACYSSASFFLCALGLFWLLLDDNAEIKLRKVKGVLSLLLIAALIAPVVPILVASPTPTSSKTSATQKADPPSLSSGQDSTFDQNQVSNPKTITRNSSAVDKPTQRGFSGWTRYSNGYDWNAAPESEKRDLCRRLERVSNDGLTAEFYYEGLNALFDTADSSILSSSLDGSVTLLGAGARSISK